MTRAVIYVDGSVRPSKDHIGRQKKLQTCHMYCERMGYDVVKVITSATPKPSVADEAMRIYKQDGREALRAFLDAQPHHPEDDADVMLDRDEADVKVCFVGIGDSYRHNWRFPPEVQEKAKLPRIEYASLWELEPPTPEQRLWHKWFEEDAARRHRNEPTRAVIYVRAAETRAGREAAKMQEQYCRGYCSQRSTYEVAEVCCDTIPAGVDGWPALRRAVRAVEEGQAHLLVALDEKTIADDAETLTALRAQVPRIEYADAYAAGIQLQDFIERMERLMAILGRTHSAPDSGRDAEELHPEQQRLPEVLYRIHTTTDVGLGSHKHVVKAEISHSGDPLSPTKRNVSIGRLITMQESEGATFEVVASAPRANAFPRGRFVQCACGGYTLVEAGQTTLPAHNGRPKR
jgi:hypothetical protein